ncbi:FAD-binding oxidoreductase [Shimia ponticola]|uniref:FAD-binding oxidoreductase n=1 Tax=Shimia ponticola TaxID=2582893 RepID=UPI00164B9C96|nr:FAD-binding oxidoreductase [Shimia ponticola]
MLDKSGGPGSLGPSESFSGLISQTPASVKTVFNAAEAQACIKAALDAKQPVNFRGAGHSFGDHCISDGGVLILNADKSRFDLREDHSVLVSGGFTWTELERRLNRHGRRCPVLTNWPDVTVAGTMAFGGFGCSSYSQGSQVDNVTAIELIDGSASVRRLGPADHDLWGVATCASGRLGFITAVEMSTQPLAPHLAQFTLRPPSVEALTQDLQAVASAASGRFEMMMGQIDLNGFKVVIGQPCEPSASTSPALLGPDLGARDWRDVSMPYADWFVTMQERAFKPKTAYIWADYVVAEEHLAQMLKSTHQMAFAHPGAVAWRPRTRILAMQTKAQAPSPQLLSTTRVKNDGILYGVGVYLEPHIEDDAAVQHCRHTLHELLETCLGFGGRPYLSGWHEPDAEIIADDDLSTAREILARQDNDSLMNPGQMPLI